MIDMGIEVWMGILRTWVVLGVVGVLGSRISMALVEREHFTLAAPVDLEAISVDSLECLVEWEVPAWAVLEHHLNLVTLISMK